MTFKAPLLLALGFALAAVGPALADGAPAAYQRCAVCHLANGRGVPGAFPPLAGRVAEAAASPAGRKYLAAVPQNGLTGEIKIGQAAYRGFMPRQAGIAPADLAAILNYLAAQPTAAPKGFKPFTASEIEALQKESAAMQPADLAKLRAEVPALSEAPR